MHDLIDRFIQYSNLSESSKKLYRRTILQLIDFTEKDPVDIVSDDIAAFKELRLMKASRVTVNKDLHRLSSFFEFLVEDGKITTNPVARIKKFKLKKSEEVKIRYIKHEEALRLIKAPIDPLLSPSKKQLRDHAILATLYYCGLRTSEVERLRWIDVDWEEQTLFISESKGHRSRYVSVTAPLLEILRQWNTFCEAGSVFGVSSDSIRLIVSKYATKAKIKVVGDKQKVTPVILRHSYATYLTENGVSEQTLGELMGNPTAVKHYSHITRAAKQKAASYFDN